MLKLRNKNMSEQVTRYIDARKGISAIQAFGLEAVGKNCKKINMTEGEIPSGIVQMDISSKNLKLVLNQLKKLHLKPHKTMPE